MTETIKIKLKTEQESICKCYFHNLSITVGQTSQSRPVILSDRKNEEGPTMHRAPEVTWFT